MLSSTSEPRDVFGFKCGLGLCRQWFRSQGGYTKHLCQVHNTRRQRGSLLGSDGIGISEGLSQGHSQHQMECDSESRSGPQTYGDDYLSFSSLNTAEDSERLSLDHGQPENDAMDIGTDLGASDKTHSQQQSFSNQEPSGPGDEFGDSDKIQNFQIPLGRFIEYHPTINGA